MSESTSSGAKSNQNRCEICGAKLSPHVCDGECPNCFAGFMMSPAENTLEGVTYGPYEIIELIASGGMGRVYRARHTELGRIVALKLVRAASTASDDRQIRFQREAQAIARLHHPHIVPIYEVGEVEGECYFAMRLIDGPPLNEHQWQRESRSDFVRIATVIAKTAEAVHFAHQHGILHRDIKPGNVLLDSEGEPHLTDFGLARFFEEGSEVTQSNSIVGTPNYMAPEQIEGPASALTSTADVYGLGAVLFSLITGESPFSGDHTMTILKRVVEDPAPSPRSDNPKVPRDLDTIVTRSLSKRPGDRYASASEFAADLRRFVDGQPILARRLSAVERVGLFVQRRPLVAGLAALVILLLLIVAIGSPLVASHQFTLRQLAETAQDKAETLSIELLHKNYQSIIQLAQSHIDGERPHLAPPLLWRTDPEMRGWEWGYLIAQCPIDPWTFDLGHRMEPPLAVTKDGRSVFLKDPGGDYVCVNTTNRTIRWRIPTRGDSSLDVDPTGRFIALSRQIVSDDMEATIPLFHGIEILDAETGERVTNLEPRQSSRAHWSGDGKRLYTFSRGRKHSSVSSYSVDSFELLSRKDFSAPRDISRLSDSHLTKDETYLVGVDRGSREVFGVPLEDPASHEILFSGPPGSSFRNFSLRSRNGDALYGRSRQIFRHHPAKRQGKMIFDSPGVIIGIFRSKNLSESALVCTSKEAFLIDNNASELVLRFPENITQAVLLENETLLTLSERGVLRIHHLTETVPRLHAIQATPEGSAEGRQVEISDDEEMILLQDWRNRSLFVSRWESGRKLAFKKIPFGDLGHVRSHRQVTEALPVFRPGSHEIVTRTTSSIRFFSLDTSPPSLVHEIEVGDEPYGVQVDRSGEKLLYSLKDRLILLDMKSNERQQLIPSPIGDPFLDEFPIEGESLIHLQRSGHYAAVVDGGRIRVCRTSDGAVLFEKTYDALARICLHPTEPLIAHTTFEAQGPIFVHDLETKQIRISMENHQRSCLWMRFSPEGKRLFVNSASPGQVSVWDWEHDLQLLRIANETGGREGAITPNGRILGSTDYRPTLHLRFALPWHFEYATSAFLDAVAELRNRLADYQEE